MEETKAGEEEAFAAPADKLVLVVDDDPLIRDLLELTLGTEGFRLLLATDGLDAAKKLEAATPHLIICDLMMPGQGGFEFLRGLQGSDGGRLPVVIITASQVNASTVGMMRQEVNVVEFLNKPIPMNKLMATLHRHLRTRPSSPASGSRGLNDR